MPEQFEVWRMAEYLKEFNLLGQSVQKISFPNLGYRMALPNSVSFLKEHLIGQPLLAIHTKAKYTFLSFPSGTWVWHYRFTGIPHLRNKKYSHRLYSIFSLPISEPNAKYCRLTIKFDSEILDYIDTRCLSKLSFYPNMTFESTPEYLKTADDLFSFEKFDLCLTLSNFKSSNRLLKQWLLDQAQAPSGIGNYLACEILAFAKLYPFLKVSKLRKKHLLNLQLAIKNVKKQCFSSAEYNWFTVFKRQNCANCGHLIVREKIPVNAQTTHYCPFCQKMF